MYLIKALMGDITDVTEVQAIVNAANKTYVAQYIKEHCMEKVSRGLYIMDDVWPDELFILQQS